MASLLDNTTWRPDPSYDTFRSNYVQLVGQWSEHLCRSGHYDAAVLVPTQAGKEQPGETFFREAAIEVLAPPGEKELGAPEPLLLRNADGVIIPV